MKVQIKRLKEQFYHGLIISTVFIGTDSNVSNAFPPIVFETMIARGENMTCIREDTRPGKKQRKVMENQYG